MRPSPSVAASPGVRSGTPVPGGKVAPSPAAATRFISSRRVTSDLIRALRPHVDDSTSVGDAAWRPAPDLGIEADGRGYGELSELGSRRRR
jgi:hypothetical protein